MAIVLGLSLINVRLFSGLVWILFFGFFQWLQGIEAPLPGPPPFFQRGKSLSNPPSLQALFKG